MQFSILERILAELLSQGNLDQLPGDHQEYTKSLGTRVGSLCPSTYIDTPWFTCGALQQTFAESHKVRQQEKHLNEERETLYIAGLNSVTTDDFSDGSDGCYGLHIFIIACYQGRSARGRISGLPGIGNVPTRRAGAHNRYNPIIRRVYERLNQSTEYGKLYAALSSVTRPHAVPLPTLFLGVWVAHFDIILARDHNAMSQACTCQQDRRRYSSLTLRFTMRGKFKIIKRLTLVGCACS